MNGQIPPTGNAKAETAPARAKLVLLALILVAAVANLNLAVANVALPSIGLAFNASQTSLNLIAVGYSLGLAGSVLYFGALGDRFGRKMMLILGTVLAIPFSVLAAFAPNENILFVARVGGGLSAGMAYPTTLALITALWSGPARTRSIALWSGIGAAIAALGPMLAGLSLEHFWWGSVFLITLPLAVVALVMAPRLVPAHVNEGTEPVDNLGGMSVRFPCGRRDPRHQLLGSAQRRHTRGGARGDRGRRRNRVRGSAAARVEPTVRPEGGQPPHVLGRRLRRHHRLSAR